MTLRDKRQIEFANKWLETGRFGILNLCPRFGKIRTAINIFEKLPKDTSILIAYPDIKIKDAWISDFQARNFDDKNVTYTTHISLHKHEDKVYDLIVLDEIHLLSEAQIGVLKQMLQNNSDVLGLTGTLASDTEDKISQELDLPVVAEYPIEQAIKEGIIVDYEIFIKRVPLDNVIIQDFGTKKRTEKKHFDSYSYVIKKMEYEGGNTMFLRLARMRIIQNSIAKRDATREMMRKWKDERILIFCGVTKIADSLGCPSYHSKSSEKELFNRFANGEGNHLAVVKIGNTGVTYKPLNRVIINYFDSNAENLAQKINRCMAMEYSNPDKKAHIYIISSNEEVELKWLNKALEFFDKTKIKYI